MVVLAGGGGGVAYALAGSSSAAGTATTTTTTVTTGTVQATVTTTGTIEPKQNDALSFAVSGTVTSVAASVGQKVSKGAVLATVDSTMLQSAVTTAQAAVTAADQQVAAVAGSSATQVAAAQAQLASANTDLANAEASLASASLTAPFSGTVAAVTMAVGDVVGSGSTTGQKTSQSTSQTSTTTTTDTITLISTDAWIVNASVGSSDLAQLKKGMQAQITPTGATQQVFGTVSSLGIVATSSGTGTSATFPVVIAVTGNPSGLYAGASATVNLVVKQLSNVLTVPTAAISTVNGQPVVYRIVSGQRTKTVVTLGDSYGPSTVVTKGLKDGDQVSVPLARPGGTRRPGTGGGGGGAGGGFGGFTRSGTTG
ncbi:MAG: HlyD family efflux transporter periplasmic adaptor subunit [Frankiales bacterium]|nr:HlyD family efflux transporter periplasmic adaptor subunit [Frankiales bacterium]